MRVPVVSVITPVYNSARFLPRLFACVANQVGVYIEHILVDDCSTDCSLQLMNRLAAGNESIHIISMPKNQGPVVARNIAISAARGKYLAFLDADDYWLPNKCMLQSQFMEVTGVALSFSDYRFISEDGRLVGRRLRGPASVGWTVHHLTRYLGCLTIMVNREQCLDFEFPEISPSYRAEDFLAWSAVISKHGPALRCKHDLARYSVVQNSRSSNAPKAALSVWKLYRVVEKIPFLKASIFFGIYCLFAALKRLYCRPHWTSKKVDAEWSTAYLLRVADD
jgi:glycosyltransferase involved in cell wall biosynthesis